MHSPGEWLGRRYAIIAALLATVYGILWGAIDYLLYHTFNLHIWDVGANFVLTRVTAPPSLGYDHLAWAPQNLIYVFFIPIARLFPDPIVLVYVQDALMAIGGYVIFLIALKAWARPGFALLAEALYLFNYALFGAPFFPNHYEILFSVFFPIAFFLYLSQRIPAASVVLVLAAVCSSLAAVEAVLFVLLFLWPDIVQVLKARGQGLRALISRHRYPLAAAIASVGVFILPFATVGAAVTLSYGHFAGGTSPNVLLALKTGLPTKVVYTFLVLLPFVPLLGRSRYTWLALPYFVLVFLSGANNYDQFSYQYTYTVGAILFIAAIDGLRRRYGPTANPAASAPPESLPARSRGSVSVIRRLKAHPELFQATVVIVALGFVVLPYSPGNAYAGPYASLPFRNYQLPETTTITPYDQALWTMAQEVPMDSSVLIQENMPMLTNRAVWYEPGSYDGENVSYALADPATYWFVFDPPAFIGPHSVPMIVWVNDLYENRSYGIVGEYEGAVLLERGYVGAPTLFSGSRWSYPGTAFVGPHVTHSEFEGGDVSVTNVTGNSTAFYTEGTIILSPGKYVLTAELRTSSITPGNHASFGLWTAATVPTRIATIDLNSSSFATSNTWTRFTLNLSVGPYLQGIRLAAYQVQWAGTLSLASVFLNQTAPG